MKIKIFFVLCFITLFLTGCSLFGQSTKTPTTIEPTVEVTPTPEVTPTLTPTTEAVLEEIYVKNKTTYYVDLGEQFNTSNLVVMAKYSDEKEVDISSEVKYSMLNTTNVGKKELEISYEDKNTSIEVNVVKLIGIELDTTNTKKLYSKDDVIDISNLFVYNLYEGNLKLASHTFTISLLDGDGDLINLNSKLSPGIYSVLITNRGFDASYKIEVIDGDLKNNKKIIFNYSVNELASKNVNVYTNFAEHYMNVPEGYVFLGYSKPFDEWVDGDTITIHTEKKILDKCYIAYMNEGYAFNKYELYDTNSRINRNDISVIPTVVPSASKLLYWDLPFSFIIKEDIYTMPVFGPANIDLSTFNVTEEETIANVSANAIDVNFDQFLASTPEGYKLSSITLGINGEIVNDIPYEDDLVSAYFTDLDAETEYEVGAYYEQVQTQGALFKKSKQLTYRFHFVGFYVCTSGSVMHRIRMMYDGDCLYRFYVAPNTNAHAKKFYSFVLPVEYQNYKVVGTLDDVSSVKSDIDVDVILLAPVSQTNKCGVVFYEKTYPYYYDIISFQEVSKGGSAVEPTIEKQYFAYNNTYRYDFTGWSSSYTNVTDHVLTYPKYKETALVAPNAELTLYVGDDYLVVHSSMWNYSTVSNTKIYVKDGNNTTVASSSKKVINNEDIYYPNSLKPNTDYTITIEFTYTLDDGNGARTGKVSYNFTSMASNATLGYSIYHEFNTSTSVYLNASGDVDGFFIKTKNGTSTWDIGNSFYGLNQLTDYVANYYVRDPNTKRINYIYSDDYEFKTPSTMMYVINDIYMEQGEYLNFYLAFRDPDYTIVNIEVIMDAPELEALGEKFIIWPLEPAQWLGEYRLYSFRISQTDFETGEIEIYDVDVESLKLTYNYNNRYSTVYLYKYTDSDGKVHFR